MSFGGIYWPLFLPALVVLGLAVVGIVWTVRQLLRLFRR